MFQRAAWGAEKNGSACHAAGICNPGGMGNAERDSGNAAEKAATVAGITGERNSSHHTVLPSQSVRGSCTLGKVGSSKKRCGTNRQKSRQVRQNGSFVTAAFCEITAGSPEVQQKGKHCLVRTMAGETVQGETVRKE